MFKSFEVCRKENMNFKRRWCWFVNSKRVVILLLIVVIAHQLISFHVNKIQIESSDRNELIKLQTPLKLKESTKVGYSNFWGFTDEEIKQLSILGRRLFLHENIGVPQLKTFVIYVYKFGPRLEKRLIGHYSGKKLDPFENCSVKNCLITYNHSDFHSADAVYFHLHLLQGPPTQLERTNYNQRWVWTSDEGIFNTFMAAKDKNLDHYGNIFNWSMTYRTDSDVPVPYGRTVPLANKSHLDHSALDVFSRKNKTVAIMMSNCNNFNGRVAYVKALQQHIQVDFYGHCGNLSCRKSSFHYGSDCPLLSSYKFYLAFENANCKDYITEKAWWNGFEKEAVPVVMGCSKANYEKLFPPKSFIHVDDFESPKQLAKYIRFLSDNKEEYNQYHSWRSKFMIVNEHGYFQSNVYHYCRLCEALNYNSPLPKVYSSMKSFWNASRDCNTKKYS